MPQTQNSGQAPRIELPDYVYSQRGRSHIDNALQHRGDVRLIKTDINSFYPSTTRAMVVKMFLNEFKCAGHVASTLADICCYQQKHLPTGSPLSGYVAFFAARGMFDEISKLASDHDCKMTNIVDDITISGDAADRELLVNVRRVIRVNGLKTRNKKSKVYAAHRPKPVTGAIVSGSSLLLPNRQHLKIKLTRAAIAASTADERPKLEARLKGQLSAAQQVLKHQLGETCCAQNYKNVSST